MHHQILKAFHLYTTQGTSSNIKSWCFLILVSEGNDFFIILVLLCVTIVAVCSFKWYFVHIFDDNFTDNYWIASDWLAATFLNSYNKWLIWTVWIQNQLFHLLQISEIWGIFTILVTPWECPLSPWKGGWEASGNHWCTLASRK